MWKTYAIHNHLLLLLTIILACFVPITHGSASASDGEPQLRLYVPDVTFRRGPDPMPVVIECQTQQRIERVGLMTSLEREFRQRVKRNRASTKPAAEEFSNILVLTFENLSDEQRPYLVHNRTALRLVTFEDDAFVKMYVEGPQLMPGDVRLRAYLLVDGELRAESPPVTIRCIEQPTPRE
jgi:hypothetical protein